MYGYQSTRTADATKTILAFVGLLLIGGVIVGVFLGNSEPLNPSLHSAKVDKLKAETEALRAQAAYEQRQREIELRLIEEKATVELQALQNRRARELELLKKATTIGLIVGSVAMTALAIATSYYLIEKARALRSDKRTPSAMSQKGQDSIREAGVNPSRVSYDGFLAYCSDFALANGHRTLSLDYTQLDSKRSYYPHGISPDVAGVYLAILQQNARIVTLGTNGYRGWILRSQIKNIDDIKFRISLEAFYRQVIEWNNVSSSEMQTLASSKAHRHRGSVPAA